MNATALSGATHPPVARRTYPSDVTDRQWAQIAGLLAEMSAGRRHRTVELREVINALSYRWRTGCVWRMLPHDFPPWPTVYWYVRRWRRDGTLRQIREVLLRRERCRCAVAAAERVRRPGYAGVKDVEDDVCRRNPRQPQGPRPVREGDWERDHNGRRISPGVGVASRAGSGSRGSG